MSTDGDPQNKTSFISRVSNKHAVAESSWSMSGIAPLQTAKDESCELELTQGLTSIS